MLFRLVVVVLATCSRVVVGPSATLGLVLEELAVGPQDDMVVVVAAPGMPRLIEVMNK